MITASKMRKSGSVINDCEQNVKVSIMEKKFLAEKSKFFKVEKQPNNYIEEAPLQEIFLSKEVTLESVMNNFDRAFKRETYGIVPQTDLSLEELSGKPRKSSFWQRLQMFLFSRKKLSSLFSRSDTKTEFSVVSEGSIHEKHQETADVSAVQNFAPKTVQDSQVVSPKLSHTQESQGSSAMKGKTPSSSKSSRAESGLLSMLNRKISGRLKGQSKAHMGASFDHNQGHVKQDTSLHSLAKRTTVYTHDLIFLTEEDRRDKYETARKKREKELSLLQTALQQTLSPADSDELLVQDRNQIKSVLDLTNPVSRSASNPGLETTSDQSKNLNYNEN